MSVQLLLGHLVEVMDANYTHNSHFLQIIKVG